MEKQKESKIALSNLTLSHLIQENQFLVNGFVNKIQTTQDNVLKMKVHTKLGDKNLVITSNYFFVSDKSILAKQNPGGFSAFLKKQLFNQRIISIKQKGLDRIILIDFPEKVLILELFAKGNIILCDKEMNIIKAMKREEWKDRKLEQNEKYKFPSSKGTNPLEENEKIFISKLEENKKSFFGACVEILNVAPAILEFVFEENNLNKKIDSKDAGKEKAKIVLSALKKIYSSEESEVYSSGGAIYSTKTNKNKERIFKNINSALNEIFIEENISTIPLIEKEKNIKRESDYGKQIMVLEMDEKKFSELGEKIFLEYNKIDEILKAVKKAKEKGIPAKEAQKKINSIQPIVRELDYKKNRIKIII